MTGLSIEALNEIRTTSYYEDANSIKLDNFWKPSGSYKDSRRDKIYAAMDKIGLTTILVFLISGRHFVEVRAKIVEDLGL